MIAEARPTSFPGSLLFTSLAPWDLKRRHPGNEVEARPVFVLAATVFICKTDFTVHISNLKTGKCFTQYINPK